MIRPDASALAASSNAAASDDSGSFEPREPEGAVDWLAVPDDGTPWEFIVICKSLENLRRKSATSLYVAKRPRVLHESRKALSARYWSASTESSGAGAD